TIATSAQRDVAPLEDITASFVLVTGIQVRPDWAITDKINIRGNFGYSQWKYFELQADDFEHRVRTAGISVFWRAARHIALTGGFAREVRTSTLPLGDYKV